VSVLTALRPVDGAGTWEHTRPHSELRLTLLGTLVVCALMGALFGAAVVAGRHVMCRIDRSAAGRVTHSYCPGFHGGER
jgi:hypothetical protein